MRCCIRRCTGVFCCFIRAMNIDEQPAQRTRWGFRWYSAVHCEEASPVSPLYEESFVTPGDQFKTNVRNATALPWLIISCLIKVEPVHRRGVTDRRLHQVKRQAARKHLLQPLRSSRLKSSRFLDSTTSENCGGAVLRTKELRRRRRQWHNNHRNVVVLNQTSSVSSSPDHLLHRHHQSGLCTAP